MSTEFSQNPQAPGVDPSLVQPIAEASAWRARLGRTLLAASLMTSATVAYEVAHPDIAIAADADTYSWHGATALNESTDDYGYGTCPSDDTSCKLIKYPVSGPYFGYGESDPWGYNLRNCTSYMAEKISQEFSGRSISGWGDAWHWATAAQADGYTLDSSPEQGDIAVWGSEVGGGYGHVAYVASVSSGVATFDEYNVAETGDFTNAYTSANHPGGKVAPDEYIHMGTPADEETSTSPPPPPTVTAISSQQTGTVEHIYWATSDGVLRETWYDTANTAGGVFTNTVASYHQKITAISSQYTAADQAQHVYVGLQNGEIDEAYWGPGLGGYHDRPAETGANSPIDSIDSYIESSGAVDLFFGTDNGQVDESWWYPNQSTNTSQIADLGQPVYGITSQHLSDGTENVYWGNNAGNLYRSYFKPGWGPFTDHMASFPQPISGLSSLTTPDGKEHILSGDNDGIARETYFDPSVPGSGYNTWQTSVFPSAVHAISSKYNPTDGDIHVYTGDNSEVDQTWYHPGQVGDWAMAQNVPPVTAISSEIGSDGTTRVYWGAIDGEVRETWNSGTTTDTWTLPSSPAS